MMSSNAISKVANKKPRRIFLEGEEITKNKKKKHKRRGCKQANAYN